MLRFLPPFLRLLSVHSSTFLNITFSVQCLLLLCICFLGFILSEDKIVLLSLPGFPLPHESDQAVHQSFLSLIARSACKVGNPPAHWFQRMLPLPQGDVGNMHSWISLQLHPEAHLTKRQLWTMGLEGCEF